MTDPWARFLQESDGAENAGYIERGSAPGLPGRWAASFVRADELLRLTPDTTLSDLEERTRRALRGTRRNALLGYLGFEGCSIAEPLLERRPAGSPFPLGEFAVVRDLRARRVPPDRPRRPPPRRSAPAGPIADTLPQARFERSVRRLRQAIGNGEAFQVVLGHRRAWNRPDDLRARAGELRERERFAYFYYLRFGDREVVGASPESVLETARGRAYLSPIAATRPRGDVPDPSRPDLSRDAKELAEHRMLVDLARNDLGRVCAPGSVRLLWEERLVRFARLEHLVSRVEGRLAPGTGPWTALTSAFPAGTVSGAPKIRAVQLLQREEGTWRGPYGGAVGLLRGDGSSAWALAIRSAFGAGDRLYTAAGAGIVWGSEPRREFGETLLKLSELETTLFGGRAG